MGFKRNNPGCECCESCVIYSDNFDRADESDVSNWTEQSGDWSVSGNKATVASPSGGEILTSDDADTTSTLVTIQADLYSTSAGDELGLVEFRDSNNYLAFYVRLSGGSAHVLVKQKVAGVTTTLRDFAHAVAAANTTINFKVCLDTEFGWQVFIDGQQIMSDGAPATAYGSVPDLKYGLYCGSCTGTPTWDNFLVKHYRLPESVEFECIDCSRCATCEEPVPTQWKIVSSGWSAGTSGRCSGAECSGHFDGTIYTDGDGPDFDCGNTGTIGYSCAGGGGRVFNSVELRRNAQTSGGVKIKVTYNLILSGPIYESALLNSDVDCTQVITCNRTINGNDACNSPASITVQGIP